jgi:MFS family permease
MAYLFFCKNNLIGVIIMKKNIKVSYIYNFLTYFNITSAIWVLYLSFKGLNLVEIGLLESIFHLTSFLCEIPTGAVADIYGKRVSVILGRMISAISTIFMIFSTTFIGFAIAFIFSALSYNLNSGASDSLVYDSLKLLGRENEYKKIFGSISFYIEIARSAAVLFGGILSDIRFVYAYILALTIDISALSSAFFFKEPPIEVEICKEHVFINQVKESFNILKKKRIVLYLILFYALISTMGTTVYFYCQKHFENMHFSRTAIAVIFMVNNLLSAVGSKYAYYIERKLKMKNIIIILPILNVIILGGLAVSKGYISVLVFLLSSMLTGFVIPIFSDYINSLIPAQYRATILSFDSLCFSAFMLCAFPIVGFIGERLGLWKAFGIIGLAFIPAILFIMFKLKNVNEAGKEDKK